MEHHPFEWVNQPWNIPILYSQWPPPRQYAGRRHGALDAFDALAAEWMSGRSSGFLVAF